MVDSHLRNIPVKLFQNLFTDLAEEVLKKHISIYSPGGHFVQRSGILVEGHPKTFLYNYFKIHLLVQEKKSFKGFFYF